MWVGRSVGWCVFFLPSPKGICFAQELAALGARGSFLQAVGAALDFLLEFESTFSVTTQMARCEGSLMTYVGPIRCRNHHDLAILIRSLRRSDIEEGKVHERGRIYMPKTSLEVSRFPCGSSAYWSGSYFGVDGADFAPENIGRFLADDVCVDHFCLCREMANQCVSPIKRCTTQKSIPCCEKQHHDGFDYVHSTSP